MCATIKRRIRKKANTAKIISKIVYHREKETRRQAKQRMNNKQINGAVISIEPDKLKFGAINVDGLDLQTDAALKDLLASRDFDVRLLIITKISYNNKHKIIYVKQGWILSYPRGFGSMEFWPKMILS